MSALALVLVLISATGDEPNEAARDRAKSLLDEGNRLYRAGKIEESIEQYQAAYAAFESPKILYNLARAQKKIDRLIDAAGSFERFLATAQADEKGIDEARSELAAIDEKLGRLSFVGPAGFDVKLDGKHLGRLPLPSVRVVPGRHSISFESQETFPVVKTVVAAAKVQVTVELELQAPEPTPPIVATKPPPDLRVVEPSRPPVSVVAVEEPSILESPLFWGAVGVAVVGVAVGVAIAASGTNSVPDELGSSRFSDWEVR